MWICTGMDVLNGAIEKMQQKVPAEKWKFVGVAVAPSTITITEHAVRHSHYLTSSVLTVPQTELRISQ